MKERRGTLMQRGNANVINWYCDRCTWSKMSIRDQPSELSLRDARSLHEKHICHTSNRVPITSCDPPVRRRTLMLHGTANVLNWYCGGCAWSEVSVSGTPEELSLKAAQVLFDRHTCGAKLRSKDKMRGSRTKAPGGQTDYTEALL